MAKKDDVSRKLDALLKKDEEILQKEKQIQAEEAREEQEEEHLGKLEEQTATELKELKKIENEIKEQIKDHPLKKIGLRDLWRGLVGAFAGVIVHNALYYGTVIAEHFDDMRAFIWLGLAFIVGAVLLYATGYRKIDMKSAIWLLPLRLIILYSVALAVSIGALYLYYPEFGVDTMASLKQIAAVQMSAIIGAVTADLLGRD